MVCDNKLVAWGWSLAKPPGNLIESIKKKIGNESESIMMDSTIEISSQHFSPHVAKHSNHEKNWFENKWADSLISIRVTMSAIKRLKAISIFSRDWETDVKGRLGFKGFRGCLFLGFEPLSMKAAPSEIHLRRFLPTVGFFASWFGSVVT